MHALLLLALQPVSPVGKGDLFETHVKNLSHRRFAVREQAQQALHKLGWKGLPQLEGELSRTSDPETRRRLEILCAGIRGERLRWARETVDSRYGPDFPMIDALWLNPLTGSYAVDSGFLQGLRLQSFHRYKPLLETEWNTPSGPDLGRRYDSYRRATRELFVEWLYEGIVSVPVLDAICFGMFLQDNRWFSVGGSLKDPFWIPGWIPQKGFPRSTPYMPPEH